MVSIFLNCSKMLATTKTSLEKLILNFNALKIITRGRRVQSRQPIAVYENFAKANEAEVKKKAEAAAVAAEKAKKFTENRKPQLINLKKTTGKDVQKGTLKMIRKEATVPYEKIDPHFTGEIEPEAFEEAADHLSEKYHKLKMKEKLSKEIETLPDGDLRFGPQIQIAKSQRHRYEKRKILLEGKRLIKDAFEAGVVFDSIFMAKNANINDLQIDFSELPPETNLYKVSHKAINTWSDVETSQGFLGN